jgi:ABC-type multidrug transport system fused ATPase/permease subunit
MSKKILLVGESWMSFTTHVKGFDTFYTSVYETGKEWIEKAIKEAGVLSGADAFISNLKNGYDTPMMRYFEKDGAELSIGQWQKLSVARAFFADSDILILDEPTASLDPLAEQEIFNQFDTLRKDKTTLFVSHRLSSATVANKIVVLKNGTITEIGDHQSLMAAKGDYYTLFSTQAKRYIAGNENPPPPPPSPSPFFKGRP